MTKYWNSSMHYSQPTIQELQSKITSSNNKANKKGKQYQLISKADKYQKAGGDKPGVMS